MRFTANFFKAVAFYLPEQERCGFHKTTVYLRTNMHSTLTQPYVGMLVLDYVEHMV